MKYAILAAAAFAALLPATQAQATITLTAKPLSDLSNFHVGDSVDVQFFLGGTPGSHLINNVSVAATYVPATTSVKFVAFGPNIGSDVSTNPLAFTYRYTGTAVGPALTIGYLTALGSTEGPISIGSQEIDFNVLPAAVPEPATWAMLILGMGAVGYAMRRRQKIATRVSYAA